MSDDFSARRVHYERGHLDEADVATDPFAQFGAWFAQALETPEIDEPYGMSVATVDPDGRPSSRIVLLRGWDERGFVFYTNYESRKGAALAAHPRAALLFWWGILQRQLRVEGTVERVAPAESDAYFASRPRGHRLSAWASHQSTPVAAASDLERAMADAEARFPDAVPRPPYWGGYRVVPERFEFWQGRPNRVHDRLVYERDGAAWRLIRLSP
ncbi:MAG TPA: pyridoxamine 5'-phosphate oxidase [Candidatus Sulfotelmatobacter sp.]|nr:pyridoxamine 5'-phosphate oxidase [Candidatus Sulfotelmatobacter sp.]